MKSQGCLALLVLLAYSKNLKDRNIDFSDVDPFHMFRIHFNNPAPDPRHLLSAVASIMPGSAHLFDRLRAGWGLSIAKPNITAYSGTRVAELVEAPARKHPVPDHK